MNIARRIARHGIGNCCPSTGRTRQGALAQRRFRLDGEQPDLPRAEPTHTGTGTMTHIGGAACAADAQASEGATAVGDARQRDFTLGIR